MRCGEPILSTTAPAGAASLLFFFFVVVAGLAASPIEEKKIKIQSSDVSQSNTLMGKDADYVADRAVDGDEDTCSRTTPYSPRWYRIMFDQPRNVTWLKIVKDAEEDEYNVTVGLISMESDATSQELCKSAVSTEEIIAKFNCSHRHPSTLVVNVTITNEKFREEKISLCEIEVYEVDKHFPRKTANKTNVDLTYQQDSWQDSSNLSLTLKEMHCCTLFGLVFLAVHCLLNRNLS